MVYAGPLHSPALLIQLDKKLGDQIILVGFGGFSCDFFLVANIILSNCITNLIIR